MDRRLETIYVFRTMSRTETEITGNSNITRHPPVQPEDNWHTHRQRAVRVERGSLRPGAPPSADVILPVRGALLEVQEALLLESLFCRRVHDQLRTARGSSATASRPLTVGRQQSRGTTVRAMCLGTAEGAKHVAAFHSKRRGPGAGQTAGGR